MRINSYRPFIILSVNQPDASDDTNYSNHNRLKNILKDGFVECIGYTKLWGTERCLMVFARDVNPTVLASRVVTLMRECRQEAILFVDQFRNAHFEYDRPEDNDREYIGVWTEISQPEAEAQDHTMVLGKYFKDGKDRYYACK